MGMKPRRRASKPTTHAAYIAATPPDRRDDIRALHDMVRAEAPHLEPTMEFNMLGYGKFHYKYATGREGDWFRIGISNNKNYISMYCCSADETGYVAEKFRSRLPKASIGKSCVRFRRLSDLDESTVRELIRQTAAGSYTM